MNLKTRLCTICSQEQAAWSSLATSVRDTKQTSGSEAEV